MIFGVDIESNTATSGYPSQWNRTTSGGDYVIEQFEAAVAAKTGISGWKVGAHRIYSELNQSIFTAQPNAHTVRVQRDIDAGRVLVFSQKSTGLGNWGQVGAATSGAIYNAIVARGNEIRIAMTANPNMDMWWSFFHEPNGNHTNSATSGSTDPTTGINNWHAALQNIYTIWTTPVASGGCGVPKYVGLQDGTILQHGLLLAGPNLAGAAQYSTSAGTGNNVTDYLEWYGTPTSRPWFWDNVQMCPCDTYPGSDSGNAVYRVWPEDFIGGYTPSQYPEGVADWLPARIAERNLAGKICYPSLWEFGFLERDAQDTDSSAPSFGSDSPRWASISGLTPTRPHLFNLMRDYFTGPGATFWGGYPFHSVLYWDDMKSPTGSRGPWMPDTTAASWDAYVDMIMEITNMTPVTPTASAGVGAILG